MEAIRNAYKILVGKPEGKISLARPVRRWRGSNRTDIKDIGRDDVDWIHLAQVRNRWRAFVNTVINLRV
jgi:hypothetical protein